MPITTPMVTDCGSFEIQSLASLGIQLTNIGGPSLLPHRDGLYSSVIIQHSTNAVMDTASVLE